MISDFVAENPGQALREAGSGIAEGAKQLAKGTLDAANAVGEIVEKLVEDPVETLDEMIWQPVKRTGQALWDLTAIQFDENHVFLNPHLRDYMEGKSDIWTTWGKLVLDEAQAVLTIEGAASLGGKGLNRLRGGKPPGGTVEPVAPKPVEPVAPEPIEPVQPAKLAEPQPPKPCEPTACEPGPGNTGCFVAGTPTWIHRSPVRNRGACRWRGASRIDARFRSNDCSD